MSATPIGNTIGMDGFALAGSGVTPGTLAYRSSITVGTDLWFLPADADKILVVDTAGSSGPTVTTFDLPNVGTSTLATAANKFAGGVFELDAGSKDAALLIEIEPGAYTVRVSGANGSAGVALVEIFQIK